MDNNKRAILYAGIAVGCWSTVASMFKISLRYYTHFEMLVVAAFTAVLIFTITITIQKKWKELKKFNSKQWGWFALVGLLNPVAYYLVLFKSYDLLPAQVAQPINYFWPIILLILLAIFTKKPIPKIKYIGMFISLLGVGFISLGTGNISGEQLSVTGLLLASLSAFLWATYWIVNRLGEKTDAIIALFVSFAFGSLYLIGAAFLTGNIPALTTGFAASMYVGAFEMGIPFIFFGLALRKTENPTLINQICYLAPFISLFLIHIIVGEEIYSTTYLGLSLIISGIVFNEYLSKYFQKKREKI